MVETATSSAAPPRSGPWRHLWSPAWLARRPRPLRIAIRAVLITLATLLLVWLILFVTKGRFLKGPFEGIASSVLEREVRVGGDFQLYFAPITIRFVAHDFTIANPAWARRRNFFEARHLDARIATFPLLFGTRRADRLELDGGRIGLEWDESGRRNSWTFSDPDAPPEPLDLPQIRRAAIADTRLSYRDPQLALFADVGFETITARDTAFDSDIRFDGGGTSRGRPFTLAGGLLSPNETLAGGANRLTLTVGAAGNRVDIAGTLPGATEIEGANLTVAARGPNLGTLFDFAGIAVPDTRRYRLRSALTFRDGQWRFTRLSGVFGASDIAGQMTVSLPQGRLFIDANLATRVLDILDAGPWVGYDPRRLDAMGTAGTVRSVAGRPRVLPDAPLRIDAVRRFDASVRYRIARVRAESFPISDIDMTLTLDRGLLRFRPLRFAVAGGTVTANIGIDARPAVVRTDYDIRLSPTNMGRLLARFGTEQSGTTGTVSARIAMAGNGNSVRESLANASGRMVFILPRGTFWTRNIQLAELDIGTFVQKMFEKKLERPVQINCGLIAFTVRNGIAAADPILIDTRKNVMLGRGGFSFRTEAIDLAVRADAKTFSLFSGQSPVGVTGYFAEPGIDAISPELVGRAGAGLGLAALVAPPAALIAFVDPGDAKAAACGPVLAGARARDQRTRGGDARDDVGRGTTARSEDGRDGEEEREGQRRKFLGIF